MSCWEDSSHRSSPERNGLVKLVDQGDNVHSNHPQPEPAGQVVLEGELGGCHRLLRMLLTMIRTHS